MLAGSLVFAAGSGCFRDLAGPDFEPFCVSAPSLSIVRLRREVTTSRGGGVHVPAPTARRTL
jgi:hypothetical protein